MFHISASRMIAVAWILGIIECVLGFAHFAAVFTIKTPENPGAELVTHPPHRRLFGLVFGFYL